MRVTRLGAWAMAGLLAVAPAAARDRADPATNARLDRLLAERPVIDGHNDLPWELRSKHGGRVETTDLRAGGQRLRPPVQTDIARLTRGGYGGQFWSLWIPADIAGPQAVTKTLEAIDIVRRMVARYPQSLALATTADQVEAARASGRVASLMGIEGGHQIDGNLAVLRQYRELGVLYMTLTHSKNVAWADSATDAPKVRGLTAFGRTVIGEMNRIGMIADLSHVSADTARAALAATRAPVIFSHSNAHALNPHPRNVPDDVLKLTAANGGVVMVNVYPPFLSAKYAAWNTRRNAEAARLGVDSDGGDARIAAWERSSPAPAVTVRDVADHVDHIARVAGRDHVGLGGDYDGISGSGPQGMQGVDGWRLLFAELMRRGWSDADLRKLAGGNVLRVLRRVEAVAAEMDDAPPPTQPVGDPRG